MNTAEFFPISQAHETRQADHEQGVRLLFGVVDPTGMLSGSSASEMALNGVATIVSNFLSTAEDLHK